LPTSGSRRILAAFVVTSLVALTVLLTAASVTQAVPASPELIEQLKASGQLQKFADRINAARLRGVEQPDPNVTYSRDVPGQALHYDPNVPDTFKVLVILADFSDNPASGGLVYGQPSDFQHLLFSYDDNDNQYSMAEFYVDNSYGNFVMQGTVVGWVRLPQTYAYYVDGQNGFGSYPTNAQKMAEDAIVGADPMVDYSQFDGDGNGWVDGVFIVHAGAGAEQTGSDFMIWSHKWSLAVTQNLDGVGISSYTTEPEENTSYGLTTMGVFAHEYGHFIGLPDLYDTDYSSSGIGDWSLMAGGSWNFGGRYPAFFDAWCKYKLGFLDATNVATSQTDVAIPASYYEPVAYRLWGNGTVGNQYFLIENRQKGETDYGIPASGLLIYHIDESVGGNSNENHPKVAVEQADGKFQLEAGINQGDGGDIWSPYTKTEFDDLSTPNTRDYNLQKTRTAVWDISASDSVMHASFDVTYSRPRFEILSGTFSDSDFGNGNGIAEAGESLTFTFNVMNLWLSANNVTGTLTSDNNDIVFTTPTVNIGTVTGEGGTGTNTGTPIVFEIPADFTPCIDSFFLTVDSDVPGGARTFGFELHIGDPTVLVVDDDNGASYNEVLENLLFQMRVPFDVYDKSTSGSPSAGDLTPYQTVLWLTGDARANILSAADVTAMQALLDGGGNLFLTGQEIVKQLDADNPGFLNNYLHATNDGDAFYPFMYGETGTDIGDGLKFRFGTPTNQTDPQKMSPVGGAVSEFTIPIGGSTVISYTGTYNVVLMSFGFEAISDEYASQGWTARDTLFARIMNLFEPDTASLNPAVNAAVVPGAASILNLTDPSPTFAWSVDDTTPAAVTQYEIQVGTGSLCFNWDNMWSPGVFNGADTEVVYAGLPLEDGQTYLFRVRVFNGTTWSAWKATTFRMNSVGTPGLAVAPENGAIEATATPYLKITNTIDPEGDPVTYDFDVYSDEAMTNLVAGTTGVALTTNFTGWTVSSALPEDGEFWWHTRAFDGYEYSDYTETGRFYVNAVNQAPQAFSLLEPSDGSNTIDTFPRLTWDRAADVDAGDSVRYTLWTSTSPTFASYVETENLPDTFRTLTYPVTPSMTYYWKVAAIDLQGDTTWSSEVFTFTTNPPTCCVLRGNTDGLGGINVSDVTYLVAFLFQGGDAPPCEEEGNVDGLTGVNVADLTYLVNFVFAGDAAPPPCP